MRGNLRRDHVGKHVLSVPYDRGGCLVARTLNPQNVTLRHISNIMGFDVFLLSSTRPSSRAPLMRARFLQARIDARDLELVSKSENTRSLRPTCALMTARTR